MTYKTLEELPAMLNVSDVRNLFGIGQRQAYELVHTEGFPVLKIGSTLKIPKDNLIQWINDNVEKGAAQCRT